MSTQAKLQPDPLDQLKTMLEDAPRSYGFLSDYVRAMEWYQPEERYIFPSYVRECRRRSLSPQAWFCRRRCPIQIV